jgi:hypothetical protein
VQREQIRGQNGLPLSRFDAPAHVVEARHVQARVEFRGVEAYMLERMRRRCSSEMKSANSLRLMERTSCRKISATGLEIDA